MLLAATNSGTLIIALPDLERSLHASLLALVWVILAYLIAATVLVLMAGRLSDLFGRKRAYVGGFLLFAFASLGAGFAPNADVLIVWRVLQGVGSAFLFANAAALVTDAFPKEELGLAMGTNTMVAAIGLAIGPVLGGALVAISWHWVFWFNVPLALGGAAWGGLILRELSKPDQIRGYDVLGNITFIVGLGRFDRDRRPDHGGRATADLGADREPLARADARFEDLQEPPVRRRERRLVHQRARALCADVPVRLLLPGSPVEHADRSRRQADPARARDARRLPPRRHLC
jgi:MFS family permease